ncbi:MAG: hypothetical protein U1E61_06855 [Bradyrhizobium sp.]
MPPRSYVIAAILLTVMVAASLPLTMGFAIIFWRWLFAAAACLIAAVGAFRVVHGLRAPVWIGIALALPCLLWGADSLVRFTSRELALVAWMTVYSLVTSLAFVAAGVGVLRLAETMSRPHMAFRIGYGLLAASALLVVFGWAAYLMGWSVTRNPIYVAATRPLHIAAMSVEYGAFVGAAVLVTVRHNLETWTGTVIGLIGLYMLYDIVSSMFVVGLRGDMMFWLQPVMMLIGSAAVWRIGSLLNREAAAQRYAQA